MSGTSSLLKFGCILLGLIAYSTGQHPVGDSDPCLTIQGIPDNLSCPRDRGELECYNRTQLCDGTSFCADGSDEGISLNALDCNGEFTGLLNQTRFVCNNDENVPLTQLCDGTAHCSNGDDETTALCENKCLLPYYGGCNETRECVFTDLDLNCGRCLNGMARDPSEAFQAPCGFSATFRFTMASYEVLENAGSVLVAIILESAGIIDSDIEIRVLTVSSGSASEDVDYTSQNVTLTFPATSPGGTVRSFRIPIINDSLVEDSESFSLTASATSFSIIANPVFSSGGDTSQVTIIDDDQLVVGFQSSEYNVVEGDVLQEICVIVLNSDQLTANGVVQVSTANISGQAIGGVDYDILPSTSLTFAPGDTSQCFNVTIRDDSLDEGEECFLVNVVSQSNDIDIDAGSESSMVCIQDNDVVRFNFSNDAVNVQEGVDSNAQVCVVLYEGSSSSDIQIVIETGVQTGSAVAGAGEDYTATTSTLTFPANTLPDSSDALMCFEVPINDDNFVENSENFFVGISSSARDVQFPQGNVSTVTIADNDIPSFGFSSSSFNVNENAGPAMGAIALTSDHVLTYAISVDVVDIGGGTATDNTDYTGVAATVTFSAGASMSATASFSFPIIDDDSVESQETIFLSATINGGSPGGLSQATVVINDDDQLVVGFQRSEYNVVEGDVLQEICVIVLNSDQLTANGVVQVSTANISGQAIGGEDYDILTATSLTFAPGDTSQCFNVTIRDDSLDEGVECFRVNLVSQSNDIDIDTGSESSMVCIQDNDVLRFAFANDSINVQEGVDSNAQVCVVLFEGTPTSATQIVIETGVQTGSAVAGAGGDYTATTNTLTFPANTLPGSSDALMCFEVPINDDNLVENSENFFVGISSSARDVEFPQGNVSTVNIADNDIPSFGFSSSSFNVNENAGPAMGTIALMSDHVLTFAINVDVVDIAGGTAADNTDYTGVAATVTFSAGASMSATASFSFPIIDDDSVEPQETVFLSATINGGDPGGPSQATVIIIDDDTCIIGFAESSYTYGEAMVSQQVCLVKRNSAELTSSVTVRVQTSDIGAVAGDDYTAVNTTVTFGPGDSEVCILIPILEDDRDESEECLRVSATSSNSLFLDFQDTQDTTRVCILDNDLLDFAFSQTNYNANEDGGTVQLCVDLISGILQRDTEINLSFSNGLAIGGSDFNNGVQSVSFAANTEPAGAGSQMCINVSIVNDELVERTENFQVIASSGDSEVVFTNGNSSNVFINDDDVPVFQFTETSYSVSEGDGIVQFAVELIDKVLTFDLDVLVYDISGGSATVGDDHSSVLATLTFVADDGPASSRNFSVSIFDDDLVENQETVFLRANVTYPGVFSTGGDAATVLINDNDVFIVGFEELSYEILEAMTNQSVCLVQTNSVLLSEPVEVFLSSSMISGGATAGSDYESLAAGASVTFPVGSVRQCIDVQILDDNLDELQECFQVNATSGGAGIGIADGRQITTVCINDDDLITFTFSMSVYTTDENSSVQVCVDLVEGQLTRPIEVMVQNAGGSATVNMDYVMVDVTLVFPAGSSSGPPPTQRCLNISIINDVIVESTETIQLVASSTDADADFTPGGNMARVDIVDNNRLPVGLVPPSGSGVPEYSIPENGGPLEVCVEIINLSGQPILEKAVTVVLSTADAAPGVLSATSGQDYVAVTQSVTFNIGDEDNMLCVNITITDDDICEDDESFLIQLTPADDCANIVSGSGSATIIDNDVATIRPDQAIVHYNVTERVDSAVWIPLTLFGEKGPGRQCEVTVRTMDGSAKREMDYAYTSTTLTFDRNNVSQNIHIDIFDDTICEGHETFSVFLSTNSDGCRVPENETELVVWIWDDEVHFGDDPHFSIALPGGKLLCYSVQGEHGFSFNLISNEKIVMNSKFVPDARREEVTWLGSMGIIVKDSNYEGSNTTKLRFDVSKKNIFIGDKIELQAKKIEKLTFSNGKLIISEAPASAKFHYPSVLVDLQDVEISFTIKFTNQHLDMYWHSTGKKITDSHGLIGQFFRQGVEIDETRKILTMPGKEPVPVMRRPVWSFMEREEKDDQLCWTAMNPGYQGEGLIDGSYFDYLVDDIMSTEFKYKKQ